MPQSSHHLLECLMAKSNSHVPQFTRWKGYGNQATEIVWHLIMVLLIGKRGAHCQIFGNEDTFPVSPTICAGDMGEWRFPGFCEGQNLCGRQRGKGLNRVGFIPAIKTPSWDCTFQRVCSSHTLCITLSCWLHPRRFQVSYLKETVWNQCVWQLHHLKARQGGILKTHLLSGLFKHYLLLPLPGNESLPSTLCILSDDMLR